MDRTALLVDAAVDVLADRGARALTHRAVDLRAGLPAGSTSNRFRTRRALVEAVVRRLVERDRERIEAVVREPGSLGVVVARFAAASAGTARRETLARIALLTDAEADALRGGRDDLLRVAADAAARADRMLPDAVVALVVAMVDGVVTDAVLAGRPVDERLLAVAVDGVLAEV